MKHSDDLKELRRSDALVISEIGNTRRLTAGDAMIKPVFAHQDESSESIIKKLKREDTNVCIVVTKDKKFVGEISIEDLIALFLHQVRYEPLTKLLNVGYRRGFMYKTAEELVNKHKSTVKRDTQINKVIELVYKEGFHYVPVLDETGRVVGVVTPSSLLDLLEAY